MAVPVRPHVAALTALLTEAGLVVAPGGIGSAQPPCVVLYAAPGEPAAGSLGDPISDLISEITTVACGSTHDQALWVADRLDATLLQAVPLVAGRTSHPVIRVDATTVGRDDSLATPIHSAAIRWRLVTTPL